MQVISVSDSIYNSSVFVDTRSPAEFVQGHIPGAVNIPLLEDEERTIVGTIYTQQGPEDAKKRGLAIVSGKLALIVNQISDLVAFEKKQLVVYCWRGGMRSKSVLTILELMGITGSQLEGGYKAYRRHVQEQLAGFVLRPEAVVLCGSTGVGKTVLLQQLARRGYPTVDLEGLANHRGSAFGHIGNGKPATAQNFDAQLLEELQKFNDNKVVVVECESKRVGNVYLPAVLHQAMQQGRKILIKACMETRVARLIAEYTNVVRPRDPEVLASLQPLTRKLGKKKTARLISDYESGNLRDFTASLLTDYYDGLYGYEYASPDNFDLVVDAEDLERATADIAAFLDHLTRG